MNACGPIQCYQPIVSGPLTVQSQFLTACKFSCGGIKLHMILPGLDKLPPHNAFHFLLVNNVCFEHAPPFFNV
jgi:hypothetical protein